MATARGAKAKRTLEVLGKAYGREPARNPGTTPLDHLVYGVLAGNGPQRAARKAFQKLGDAFVDRNELRVATKDEVAAHLGALGGAETAGQRAELLLRTLQGLYDALDRVRIELDSPEDIEEAERTLHMVPGLSPGLASAVLARACPEPPVRLNAGMARVGQRVGFLPRSGGESKQAAALLSGVGTGEGRVLAHYLLTEHAERVCLPKNPDCPACPCLDFCDYGKKKTTRG